VKFKTIYVDVVHFDEPKQQYIHTPYALVEHLLTQARPYTDHITYSLYHDVNYHPDITRIFHLTKQLNYRFNVEISYLKFLDVLESNLDNSALARVYFSIEKLVENGCFDNKNSSKRLYDSVQSLMDHKVKVLINLPFGDPTNYHPHVLDFISEIGLDLNNDLWNRGFQINISPLLVIQCKQTVSKKELVAPKKIGRCYGCVTMLGIMQNGNVIPCNHYNGQRIVLGNIFHTLLSEILAGHQFTSISDGFYKNELVHPVCQHCPKPRKRF
jgi:radical SAM protein with 4Fe4S-binding SPASM domain